MGVQEANHILNTRIYSKKSGIYEIHCTVNGKRYIGATRVLNKRIKAHIRMLKENKHYNKALQADWNLYGDTAFEVAEIEHCSVDRLHQKELHYIQLNPDGYNRAVQGFSENVGVVRFGAENPMYGKNHTEESKRKIAEFRKEYTGWKHSDEVRKKQSDSAYKRWSNVPKKQFRARLMIGGKDISLGAYAIREERDMVIREFKENYKQVTSSINR